MPNFNSTISQIHHRLPFHKPSRPLHQTTIKERKRDYSFSTQFVDFSSFPSRSHIPISDFTDLSSVHPFISIPISDMGFLPHFFLFCLISVASANEAFDSQLLQFPDRSENRLKDLDGEIKLKCDSWRFNVEANNLNPWKTIPKNCSEYVEKYVTGRAYQLEMDLASKEAKIFAQSVKLVGDGNDVWVFDVDETLLSNLPYYTDHGYGSELFNSDEFDNWILRATAPAIQPSLELYKELLDLGFKLVLLTGRSENQREATTRNLINAGFYDWDRLILRRDEDQGKLAVHYKSEKRSEMENEGLRIIGNSGDQWSDLLGTSVSIRSFKLPNPMYNVP